MAKFRFRSDMALTKSQVPPQKRQLMKAVCDRLDFYLTYYDDMTEWERTFVFEITDYWSLLSKAQRSILYNIIIRSKIERYYYEENSSD